ncbi:MAG: YdcF family protein [bacterium]|nr:YdcF family protein [bacterium]
MNPLKKLKPILTSVLRVLLIVLAIEVVVCVALLGAVHFYGQTDQAQQADAIIVLGAGLRYDGRPGPALTRRTRHAAQLWRDGYAPVLLCTGGVTMGRSRSEAEGCRDILVAEGVPADAIYLEERSRSTEENALYARATMDANGWSDAVLVSDGYHLLRAQWIFSLEGITVYPSPTVNPSVVPYTFAALREVAALHWQGFLEISGLPITHLPRL